MLDVRAPFARTLQPNLTLTRSSSTYQKLDMRVDVLLHPPLSAVQIAQRYNERHAPNVQLQSETKEAIDQCKDVTKDREC